MKIDLTAEQRAALKAGVPKLTSLDMVWAQAIKDNWEEIKAEGQGELTTAELVDRVLFQRHAEAEKKAAGRTKRLAEKLAELPERRR